MLFAIMAVTITWPSSRHKYGREETIFCVKSE